MNLEPLLRRDRWIVIGALTLVAALAWVHLVAGAGMDMSATAMTRMYGREMYMPPIAWTPGHVLLMFWMWWIVMAAMMLPSATPALLLVAALHRNAQPSRLPYGSTGSFAAGYLVAWAGFSAIAVAAQWALTESGAISEMMQVTNGKLAGAVLIAAGLWQFTPVKRQCLRRCRAPAQLLAQHRRTGTFGGLLIGMRHGWDCLGCCWALMALLFVGGVMNLYWIIGIALFVLIEKLLPAGDWFGRVTGGALVLWGLALTTGLL